MAVAMLPLIAAFEAHVVNVTARIENALNVSVKSIDFGTVFPQEKLDQTFNVLLSQSFRDEDRVDDVDYFIRQKPKCWDGNEKSPTFGQVAHNEDGSFQCVDANFTMLPLLCPYLSKNEVSSDGLVTENDGAGLSAFHGPIATSSWTLAVAKQWDVKGHLAKAQQDYDDTWNIDLKVPCFGGYCAQDWESFVTGVNPTAIPADYVQPIEQEHKLFGCDLWLEVGGISLPGFGCEEELDMMLVLDRSGSIDSTEMTTLKTAASAFVTALMPAETGNGVHIGQSSFSTTGSLDQHLTDVQDDILAAIAALSSSNTTDLEAGITLAVGELDNSHGHERPTVKDVMVIITDGNPNVPDETQGRLDAAAAADAARSAGIEVFVVGVGVTLDTENFLKTDIADDAAHYFSAINFDDLETVLESLVACEED